jgi:hypothetical protein
MAHFRQPHIETSTPRERLTDDDLKREGRGTIPIVAEAGDVALFVSDIWYRRMPLGSEGGQVPDGCLSSATTGVAISPNEFDPGQW